MDESLAKGVFYSDIKFDFPIYLYHKPAELTAFSRILRNQVNCKIGIERLTMKTHGNQYKAEPFSLYLLWVVVNEVKKLELLVVWKIWEEMIPLSIHPENSLLVCNSSRRSYGSGRLSNVLITLVTDTQIASSLITERSFPLPRS